MKLYQLTTRAVLRNEKGEVLIMQRPQTSKYFPGYWELPGGKVDLGEHFIDGLIREIFEETGFHVEPEYVLGTSEYEVKEKRTVYLFFKVNILSGSFQISKEHTDFCWADKAKLKSTEFPPHLQETIDKIAN